MLYDAIIILGSKPDATTWQFPSHVIKSLDKAVKLYKSGATKTIVVSGNHALWFDRHGIREPQSEADMMAAYLQAAGVPEAAITKEAQSKDTIANLYYVKRTVLRPANATKLLFIVGDFRLARLQYLVKKVLGLEYDVTFQTVSCAPSEIYPSEAATFTKTKYYLDAMPAGDDRYLDGWFYDHAIYTVPWPLQN